MSLVVLDQIIKMPNEQFNAKIVEAEELVRIIPIQNLVVFTKEKCVSALGENDQMQAGIKLHQIYNLLSVLNAALYMPKATEEFETQFSFVSWRGSLFYLWARYEIPFKEWIEAGKFSLHMIIDCLDHPRTNIFECSELDKWREIHKATEAKLKKDIRYISHFILKFNYEMGSG